MKAVIPTLVFLVCIHTLAAQSLPEITTLSGREYLMCEIVRVHPDGVSFRHSRGAAKVLFTDLSPEWRARLGYDPAKARAHEREMQARREAEKAERQRHAEAAARAEEARFQALAAAAHRDHLRSLGQEAQARASAMRAAQQPQASSVRQLPELGAVFTPEGIYRQAQVRPGWAIPWQGGLHAPGMGWPAHGSSFCPPCRPPAVRTGSIRLTWRP